MIHKANKQMLAFVAAAVMLAQGGAAYGQFGGGAASEPVPLGKPSIEEKLDGETSFDFIEAELEHVARDIGQQHDISIILDRRELEEAGVGTDLPITRSLQGIPLGTVLDLLLDDADLTYVIRDEYVLITTAEAAQGMLDTRVYSVGDLLNRVGAGASMDGLINAIQATVGPSTWDIVGGEGSIQPLGGLLVVSQTQHTHREIDALLEKLRAAPVTNATAQAHDDDVPEGRSRWEMRVYSTHGLVAHELRSLLYTLLPELADIAATRLMTVARAEDQEGEAASDAALEGLGLPRGGWLVIGQHPRVHDRVATLLGEGKLIEERDAAAAHVQHGRVWCRTGWRRIRRRRSWRWRGRWLLLTSTTLWDDQKKLPQLAALTQPSP